MSKFENENLLKKNLINSSLFVTGFEILKEVIQERIKSFLCLRPESEQYDIEVINKDIQHINKDTQRDYHLFYSSCLWLQDNGVITENDLKDLEKIRKHRNMIVHNPLDILVDDKKNISLELLYKSQYLLKKITTWWIMEVEIATNEEYDRVEIKEEEVEASTVTFMKYLTEIANDV